MGSVSKEDEKEIYEVIHYLWGRVDQARITDLVDFAFKTCPYKARKDILKILYNYSVQSLEFNTLNPGIDKEEFAEYLKKADLIV